MATATYPANRSAAQAVVRILPGGKVFGASGTQDLGTGMYTMMAQTAAQALGMDPTLVEVELGDSTLPKAPVSGGSQSTASVTPAVQDAAQQAKLKLAELAIERCEVSAARAEDGTSMRRTASCSTRRSRRRSDTFAAID